MSHGSNKPTMPQDDDGAKRKLSHDLPGEVTEALSASPSIATPEVVSDATTAYVDENRSPSSNSTFAGIGRPGPVPTQVIGGYRLDGLLGEGGMGRVYRGLDSHGKAVAVKLLSSKWSCSEEALQRFKQEGLIASQINHPHCVFVHRVDEDRGTPFIAMELMSGQTLKDLVVNRGPLPAKEALALILQCIEGLIEAHDQGMIHRDVKPANCYLDDHGNVKIGDFGLARSLVDDSELTRTGAFLGTPLYASPEQLLGQPIDERSDIYSLSATLYYMLAGRAPFESPNAAQVIAKIASTDPPSFRELGVAVPKRLEAIVMKGLARDRSKRYPSLAQMAAELQPLATPQLETAPLSTRALAGVIDAGIGSVLTAMTTFAFVSLTSMSSPGPFLPNLIGFIIALGYFGIQETFFGTSIGKRLLRLRVVDMRTGDAATWKQIAIRAGVFALAFHILRVAVLGIYSSSHVPDSTVAPVVTIINQLLAFAFLFAYWWKSGKKQFTHEVLSGTTTRETQTIRMPTASTIELPQWNPALAKSKDIPPVIGRFNILGQLPSADEARWYLGYDPTLNRNVWIQWHETVVSPISEQRKQKAHRIRMRAIESGILQGHAWDAFVAPEGVPLSVCLAQHTYLPWPVAYRVLEQIAADQISAANASQSNPILESDWRSDRLWLSSSGRITLAETSLSDCNTKGDDREVEAPLKRLVRDIAITALSPAHTLRKKYFKQLSTGVKRSKAVPALTDLPPHRGLLMLERLARGEFDLDSLRTSVSGLKGCAPAVTSSMRLSHSLAVALFLLPALVVCFVCLTLHSVLVVASYRKESSNLATMAHVLRTPEHMDAVVARTNDDQRRLWTSADTLARVESALSRRHAELKRAYSSLGLFERLILSQGGIDQAIVSSPPKPRALNLGSVNVTSADGATESEAGNTITRLQINAGRKQIVVSNADGDRPLEIDEALTDYGPLLERAFKGMQPQRAQITFDYFIVACMCTLIFWTGMTKGGLLQRFTGVSVMRRDGSPAGRLRCLWRTCVLLAPFFVLVVVILALESHGFSWLWLTAWLKKLLLALPVLYLVSAILYPQIAPHDRASYTVLVPR